MNHTLLITLLVLVAANFHSACAEDGQARHLKKSAKAMKSPKATKSPTPSYEPSLSPTVVCDVKDFVGLQGAINEDENNEGSGDIKLCPGNIVFTERILLSGKELTFTCPHGSCVLDAESKSPLFAIEGGTISFDGITFKNGNAGSYGVESSGAPTSGGAISISEASVVISACRFVENAATGVGGAIANSQGTVVIKGSEFVGNTATGQGGSAGAIGNDGGSMVITGSIFKDNTATNTANNIFEYSGDVTCDDGANSFQSSGGGGNNDPAGNWPAGLCAS